MDIRFIFSHFLKVFLFMKLIQRIQCVNPVELQKTDHSDNKRDVGFLLIGNKIITNSTESISKLLQKTKYSNPPSTTKFHEAKSSRTFPQTPQKSKVTTKMKDTTIRHRSTFESTKDVTAIPPTFHSSQSMSITDKNIENIATSKTNTDIAASTSPAEHESSTEVTYSTEPSTNAAEIPLKITTYSEKSSETIINVTIPTTESNRKSKSDNFTSSFTPTSSYTSNKADNLETDFTTHIVNEKTSERTTENSVSVQGNSTVDVDVSTELHTDQSAHWIKTTTEKIRLTSERLEATEGTTVDIQSTGIITSVADFEQSSVESQNIPTLKPNIPTDSESGKETTTLSITSEQTTDGDTNYHQHTSSVPDFDTTFLASSSDINTIHTILNLSDKSSDYQTSTSRVSTFSTVTNASSNSSEGLYITNIQLKPKKDGDDTYWPIAMAITIAVPTIIVVGITITVIHKKRKLERAHTLTGYITPPTEYDV